MLSVIVPIRNTRAMAANCLTSLLNTFVTLNAAGTVEFILMDDDSDESQKIPDLLTDFRQRVPQSTLIHFRVRQHYTRACALGFSLAKGDLLLLVSHDMILTPDYIRTLMQVASLSSDFGIVRGTSNFVDCFPQHTIAPPLPLRSLDDILNFSSYMSRYFGIAHTTDDEFLTGDSILIKRSLIEKIGVFDTRYFGYFGDIDFGLRAQRAGFKIVCAKGAWLHHEGGGHYKDQSATTGVQYDQVHADRMQVVSAAYDAFRQKWDASLPAAYQTIQQVNFASLRALPPLPDRDIAPKVLFDPLTAELVN
jgi:GT2 family glycosyltransferase